MLASNLMTIFLVSNAAAAPLQKIDSNNIESGNNCSSVNNNNDNNMLESNEDIEDLWKKFDDMQNGMNGLLDRIEKLNKEKKLPFIVVRDVGMFGEFKLIMVMKLVLLYLLVTVGVWIMDKTVRAMLAMLCRHKKEEEDGDKKVRVTTNIF